MSIRCNICQVDLIRKEDSIECKNCNNHIHFFCAGYSEANFKKLTQNSKSRFLCSLCQKDTTKTKLSDTITSNMFDHKLEDIIKSINFMGAQFDDFNKKIDSVLDEIKNLKSENKKIIIENKRLGDEIDILKTKIDDLEQLNLGHSVEIKGITKTKNENCLDIVQLIATKANSDVIVNSAYRINTPGDGAGILIADLKTSVMKKDFIRKVKNINFTANMIAKGWSSEQKIYVNERLTKTRRLLFFKTRNICKEKQYKYVWINNADILVKKDDGSKTTRIKSEADFNNL